MLVKILILSFLIFGVTYPLFFWLSHKNPIKHNFHRFHLACPIVVAGLAILGLWLFPFDGLLRGAALLWLLAALIITALFWNKQGVHLLTITFLSIGGIIVYGAIFAHLVADDLWYVLVSILSGLIVSAAFYAMNLGHFYLNVLGLKVDHLKSAVDLLGRLIGLRFVYEIMVLPLIQLNFIGEKISAFKFMLTLDGFMIWVGIFFGVIFPLGALYFARGTLQLRNTQATTGILYVVLSGILLGDLILKYSLIKYHIPL